MRRCSSRAAVSCPPRGGWPSREEEIVTDTFEEEFAGAEERVKAQEIPDAFGELRQTKEGDRLLTRYLGRDVLPPFDDVVFRFVSYPGEPRPFYLRKVAQLEHVLENAAVGDIVGLVRGRDKDIGKPNPMQTWDGWIKPCDEPLGATGTADGAGGGADDDIPFMPTA